MLEKAASLCPPIVHDIVQVIGWHSAIKLVQGLGGVSFHFGKGKKDTPRLGFLIEVIGVEHAYKMCEFFGGDKIYIPQCRPALIALRNRKFLNEVQSYQASGFSKTRALEELCPKYRISDRLAWKLLRGEIKDQMQQGSLF